MAIKLKNSVRAKISIDITPLVDVVFILLIFFMVSSQFVDQPGIKLVLPQASSSHLHSSKAATIIISEDLELFLGSTEVTLDALPEKLRLLMQAKKKKILIVRADKKVPHGEVIKVMDIAKKSGVKKLIISTQSRH